MVLPASNGGGEVSRPGREPGFAGQLRVRGTVDVPAIGLGDLLDSHSIAPDQVAFVWSDGWHGHGRASYPELGTRFIPTPSPVARWSRRDAYMQFRVAPR